MTKQLDPVAIAALREIAEGEAEFVTELVSNFLQSGGPGLLAEMRQALAQSDVVALTRAAHSLKSNAATLGAVELRKLCAELELAGRSGTLAGADEKVAQIELEYERTRPALESLCR